jgi:hypothetical protein
VVNPYLESFKEAYTESKISHEQKEAEALCPLEDDGEEGPSTDLRISLDVQVSLKGKLLQAKSILERSGWTKGRGLGAEQEGIIESISVKAQFDKSGLGYNPVYEDEDPGFRRPFDIWDELTVSNPVDFKSYSAYRR